MDDFSDAIRQYERRYGMLGTYGISPEGTQAVLDGDWPFLDAVLLIGERLAETPDRKLYDGLVRRASQVSGLYREAKGIPEADPRRVTSLGICALVAVTAVERVREKNIKASSRE